MNIVPEKKNIHVIEPEQITEPITEPQLRGFQFTKAPMEAVTAPTGGATIDAESRTAINDIVAKLVKLGLFKQT